MIVQKDRYMCEDFVEDLFGDSWDEQDLPSMLMILKEWELNAKRYCVILDYATEIHLGYEVRTREDFKFIDDLIDAMMHSEE